MIKNTDKLNIVDPHNNDFGLMLGISVERQKEIAKMLDEMVNKPEGISLVYVYSIIEYLEEHVENKEEFFYAFMNHMYWLLIKNRALSPELADAYKRKYPVHNLKNKEHGT